MDKTLTRTLGTALRVLIAALLVITLLPTCAWADEADDQPVASAPTDEPAASDEPEPTDEPVAPTKLDTPMEPEPTVESAPEPEGVEQESGQAEPTEDEAVHLVAISDGQLAALGGRERFSEEFTDYLKEHRLGGMATTATLRDFEDVQGGAEAIFELDDADLTLIAVTYTVADEGYRFELREREAEPIEPAESTGDREEVDESDTLEEASGEDDSGNADKEEAAGALDEDDAGAAFGLLAYEPMASPPSSLTGYFYLGDGFYAYSSQSGVNFPGTVTIDGYGVARWGNNGNGDNGCFSCISPGAANWGDPYNGNNRRGRLYATYSHSWEAMGIAWYRVDRIVPETQPAAPGSTSGIQYLGNGWVGIIWDFQGQIELYKSSAAPAVTSDNSCYSLEGAVYGVYNSGEDASVNTNRVATLVTDRAGYAKSGALNYGTYYLKEITASKGYAIDQTIYAATVSASVPIPKVYSVEVPLGDPVGMMIQKLDSITGEAWGQDDSAGASLAGGRFTLRYYDGQYSTVEAAEASGAPTRMWVVETKVGGLALFREDYLVTGSDALYFDSTTNAPIIPLGTVLIKETEAPAAYLMPSPNPVSIVNIYLDDTTVKRKITTDGTSHQYIERLNKLCVQEQPRTLELVKKDALSDELLGGAQFVLYKESAPGKGDWKEIVTKVTDADGSSSYSPIAIGSYKLVETKASVGYLLPSATGTPVEHLFTIDGATTTKTITATNYKNVKPEVFKVDAATDEPLAGAVFELYCHPVTLKDGAVTTDTSKIAADAPGWEKLATVTTGADGKAKLPVPGFGHYKLVEVKAPAGYQLPGESGLATAHFLTLDKDNTATTIVAKDHRKPDIPVEKRDALTGKALSGAVFELYRYPVAIEDGVITTDVAAIAADASAWEELITVTTGTDGKALFEALPFGYYKVVETKAPEGYHLPSTVGMDDTRTFKLDADNAAGTLTFEDYAVPGAEVFKVDAATDEPLAGAIFDLYSYPVALKDGTVTTDTSRIVPNDPAWRKVATVTTGADGKARLPVPGFGHYKLVEVKAPEGYQLPGESGLDAEILFTLDKDSTGEPLVATDYKESDILVDKRDSDTHEPVADTEFTVYSYPVTLSDGTIVTDVTAIVADDPAWVEVARVVTDTDGKALFEALPFGYYKVVETKAPEGYHLPSAVGMDDTRTFKLDADNPSGTLTFEDYAIPGAEVLKVDAEGDAPLAGAVFELYSYPVALKDGAVTTDTSAIAADDPAWKRLATVTTGADGKARLPVPGFGHYKLVEVKAPLGYQLPGVTGTAPQTFFTLDKSVTVKALVIKDYKTGDARLEKRDAKTGAALSGAKFTLYRYPITIEDGVITTDVAAIAADASAWEELATVTTDADGKAAFEALPFGYYKVVETKAPEGYHLPSAVGMGDTRTFKLDADNPSGTLTFEDHAVPGAEVLKVDAEGDTPLAGAVFELYSYPVALKDGAVTTDTSAIAADDPAWKRLATVTTDGTGKARLPVPGFGHYKLVEVKAPAGYQLPGESGLAAAHFLTLDKDNTTTTIVAKDYKTADILMEKHDRETHEPLGDTEFTVYRYPVTIEDGVITTDVAAIVADDPAWVEVARVVTDTDGKALFEALPFGYYQLKETRPNPAYASYEESGGGDRFVRLDKYATDEAQVFEDDVIQISCEVYKKTIAVTSSGLDGSGAAASNNVGHEEYLYHFGARSTSNVWADEFIVTDDLSYVTSRGYRMTTLWTGTSPVGMDFDNKMAVLYRTNMTDPSETVTFGYNPLAGNPDNPNNPERNIIFSDEPGWRIWAEQLSTTEQTRLDVGDLGLAEEEYIVGLKVVYGGVEKGFYTGRGWVDEEDPHTRPADDSPSVLGADVGTPVAVRVMDAEAILTDWYYAVIATDALLPEDEMGNETVMRGSVSADIGRNDGVLTDHDNDMVETRVIQPFQIPTRSNGLVGDREPFAPVDYGYSPSPNKLPNTGDSLMLFGLAAVFVAAGIVLMVTQGKRERNRRSKP